MTELTHTVAAVSTPRGKGGIAVIRISGDDAVAVAARVFVPAGAPLTERRGGEAVYGRITDGDGTVIDAGIATVFRAPRSFTGEDTVELSCHGGVYVTEAVLAAVLRAGAVMAGAGEFTRRAFLNGKLSLTEAEGVGALIDAQTKGQARLAAAESRGALRRRIAQVADRLRALLSAAYAAIDYPEEDLADVTPEEAAAEMRACEALLRALADTYGTGRAVTDGVRTVLCGRPNTGKSTLYNLLAGEDRAIVTDVPGTTRDVLEDTVSAGNVLLRLADTAGLRETEDTVEKIGVSRARERIGSAELVLAVFDASRPLTDDDLDLCRSLAESGTPTVAILNKTDVAAYDMAPVRAVFPDAIALSAKTGAGREALISRIEQLFTDGSLDLSNDGILTNARQHASVLRALDALTAARTLLEESAFSDAAFSEAEVALAELERTDGRAVSDEIVHDIFSKFCVGK